MSIYGIDAGHCLSGADYGAVGIKAESNLTREVGNKVISRLRMLGHTVINCTCDSNGSLGGSLSHRYNTANSNNVDLFVSIHFNCFNGNAYGTEVFTYGAKQFTEANNVLKNISSLGFYNRGIKDGSQLSVLRNTKMKSMLVECCFCDNANDMSRYNAETMADAIVKGLVGESVSNTTQNRSINNTNLDGKVGYCTGNGVRIRDARNRNHILGYLYKGDKIKLFRKEGEWMHIYYPPHGGYVYAKYIKY